jgi:hypothetical protein
MSNKAQVPICNSFEIEKLHPELQNKYNYRKYYFVPFKLRNKNHSIKYQNKC